jgi:tRNA dimethylallyltransferase
MIRAVEVCLKTKKPFSQQRKKGQHLFNACQIGLKLDKETLEKKIDQRAEKMFQVGLIEEAKKLAKKYNPDLPSMSSIGYQEIIQYLDNKITLEQTKKLIKTHTNQYARRQMIWFKRDKRIKWIKNYSQAEKLTRNFLL